VSAIAIFVCQGKGGSKGGGETHPFPIAMPVLLVPFIQIYAVEAADSEGHDHLDEAEDGVCDVGHGHFGAVEDAHFCSLSVYLGLVWMCACWLRIVNILAGGFGKWE
jgi:hypothetical protein